MSKEKPEIQETQKNIPSHVAIIPDGNRRWAKQNGLSATDGHRKSVNQGESIIRKAQEIGIKYLTFWLFSTENWKRPKEENDKLFAMVREYTKNFKKTALKEKIRCFHIGRKDRLPEDVVATLNDLEEQTKNYDSMTLSICMDYGGHDELLNAMKECISQKLEATKENIEKHLYTKNIPTPDLIIRTSGEQRLSGFMLWQCAYTELYFPKIHYPDFNAEEFEKAIEDYSTRNRRFGGN